MKISNDITRVYDMEQKAEIKTDGKDGLASIKTNEAEINPQDISILKNISAGLPPELRQVIAELYEKGMPVDKDTLRALKIYMDRFTGSQEQKIQVIKALIGKGLEINLTNLKAVYEALYGQDMSKIIKELTINTEVEEVVEATKNISMMIDQIRDFLSKDIPLDKIGDWIEDNIKAVDVNPKTEKILLKAANESRQAASYRMEDMGIRILTKALDEVSREIEQSKPKLSDNMEEDYTKTVLASVALSGKDYIVTEITNRIKAAAGSFKELKMEISRNLDMVERYIKGESRAEIISAHNTLDKTIEMLDKAILKGDITLFTDMETEKELVKASSNLAKARELLGKGEYEKAWKLTEKVKDIFEKINWKPSHTRVVHFAKMTHTFGENVNDRERLHAAVKNLGESFSQKQQSGRMVYEALKLLGADHEGEAARYLAGEDIREESINSNIKSVLLNLLAKEQDIAQKESLLSNMADKITGQQLLSRSDKGQFQTMFFSLPLMIGGDLKDIKLYINSKKEKEKLDWENCSIFFLIETKKLGETGILLQSSGRNLSITFKNDKENIEEQVNPYFADFKDSLIELGYAVGNIAFARLNKEDRNSLNPNLHGKSSMKNINSMTKGFDARI